MDIKAYLEDTKYTKEQVARELGKCPDCGNQLYNVPPYLIVCSNKNCKYKYTYL